MASRSIRTRLLGVFAQLSRANSSFAEGDLVCDDESGELYAELVAGGFKVSRLWWEITLNAPLRLLCPCATCVACDDAKEAVRFRQHANRFVVFRLVSDPFLTMDGFLEVARLAFWGKPHTGNGWRRRRAHARTR